MLLFSSILSEAQTPIGQAITVPALPEAIGNQQEDSVFTKVDEEAKFPGGLEGWKRFLERNLRAEAPILDRSPTGIYTVTVQFVVDKEGVLSDIKAVDATEGCRTCIFEAARVMKKSPKWKPAIHNGKPVKYLAKQRINFLNV